MMQDLLSFSEAVDQLKLGNQVRRIDWNGKFVPWLASQPAILAEDQEVL